MSDFIARKNEHYVDVTTAEFYIEITEGVYAETCFVFGPIEFLGEDAEGNGRVKFDYTLLHTPEFVILEKHQEDIEQVIGSVLHKLLEDMANTPVDPNNTPRLGEDVDEIGNFDTEQPTEG